MTNSLERFTQTVRRKLVELGFASPNKTVLGEILEIAHLATLRTEEGRFVRGCITFADPQNATELPPTVRADYPRFTSFGEPLPLTVERLAKLSRAIDSWSGAIAVFGTKRSNIKAWGLVDQLVHRNRRVVGENDGGFAFPGTLTVLMDGVGALSAFHRDLFLCSMRQNEVVERENQVLQSAALRARILPVLRPLARQVCVATDLPLEVNDVAANLYEEWSRTVARICIGLRRAGTGGALLISPSLRLRRLKLGIPLEYSRLGHSGILRVLDTTYLQRASDDLRRFEDDELVPFDAVIIEAFATADAEDRADELTGAVQVVTSLASMDGVVVLSPLLEVRGFGAKIQAELELGPVYRGEQFVRRGARAGLIDPSAFGTRHGSMLRYCSIDRQAIGIVVSQDGHVRLIMSIGRSLTLWDNIQLLRHQTDLRHYKVQVEQIRRYRRANPQPQYYGYTPAPKSLAALRRTSRAIWKPTDRRE